MADEQALQSAERLAEGFEGFSATPYLCPAGVWTIGFGSTRDAQGWPVTSTTPPVTEAAARELALGSMRAAIAAVNRYVTVALTDDQKAALLDFVYNLGGTNFRTSTLLQKLNLGDFAGAAAEFDRWDHANGRELAGLLRRRQAETDLFNRSAS